VGTHDTADRKAMAKKGQAMPGGRFPISDREDLRKAIRLAGHGTHASKSAIRAYIKRRAAALGASDMIPDDWK